MSIYCVRTGKPCESTAPCIGQCKYGTPVGAGDGRTYIPIALTPEDVREIVRQELGRLGLLNR